VIVSLDGVDYARLGYRVPAAPLDSWRVYDIDDPDPGYFQFDWLSSRHPDLYHRFALSTDGLVEELHRLVDLSGLVVCDVGAGTGRSASGIAVRAREVIAVDAYESVVRFGSRTARGVGANNVTYVRGDRSRVPIRDASIDAVTCAWAYLDYAEAARILKPSGWLIVMDHAPGSLAGELTGVLSSWLHDTRGIPPLDVAPAALFAEGCPSTDATDPVPSDLGIDVVDGTLRVHDFTYTASYDSPQELAAIAGRIYGPRAASYIEQRSQATLAWRLRISYAQVKK
jgi:SAM-dependent methyltransferase